MVSNPMPMGNLPQNQSFQGAQSQMSLPRFPFFATLNFPGLSRIKNDPVCHDLSWTSVPTKLRSNIRKFEGKNGEDPCDHVTTFHLWCSLNSLNHDSIRLRLFQRTLTGLSMKLYVKFLGCTYQTFNYLTTFNFRFVTMQTTIFC